MTGQSATKVAIITGAGSGIGLQTAKLLHAAGVAVVGVGRDTGKLATLEKEIGDPAMVATISVDVTADDAPARIVALALERFGRIDFLINNAGVGSPKPVDEATDEDYDGMMDVMLRAPFRLCREVIPHLGEGSSVVNITSTYAHIGGRRGGAYSAAKGGLKSLTEHMACEYGPRGIRSNCVDPEDTAGVIAFLCSPASEMINGQSIVVDGGWTKTKYLSPRVTNTKWVDPD